MIKFKSVISRFILALRILVCAVFVVPSSFIYASQQDSIWMIPNKGQWESTIKYKIDLNQGDFYIDNKGFTFNFFETPLKHNHTHKRNTNDESNAILKAQAIKYEFLNANLNSFTSTKNKTSHYVNFIDQNGVFSDCYGINELKYTSIYPGIDLILETNTTGFKYIYSIAPQTSIDVIKQRIQGNSTSYIDKDGNLHHKHIFGEIIEKKPIAWNIKKDGQKKFVEINFKIDNNIISYEFPNGYEKSLPLIIDPELIFSSFTGSTSDNWGFTATNDNNGNLLSAGISFGVGYPTTPGTYDVNYHAGEKYTTDQNGNTLTTPIPGFDVVISKFSQDGKSLLYSTYLGGSGNETPNSIIVNKQNELLIFGATSSSNFPMTPSAYDKTYNGGNQFKTSDFYFLSSDLYVAKINSTGNNLLASTFVGGSGNEGLGVGELIYNYGDNFRGEINLTANNEVLITSTTYSSDFPTKQAFQNSLNGSQDAVIFKLSDKLDNLLFSTYLGGSGEETGNAILYNPSNDKIYVTGGTTSSSISQDNTKAKNNYNGGDADGFVAIINNQTLNLESVRFVGTASFDQNYFIQTDLENSVYVLGQSEGVVPITPGKYGNPNSGLYIQKFSSDLSQFNWSTTIGGQSGKVEISPTAFLVSECSDIFLTGWGSQDVNAIQGRALFSSTNNFPVTNDAIQKTTDGDNFYIAVLSNDASSLKYGSFFGGMGRLGSHVDGGTSRFDKKGGIYHAVCGACGGNPYGFTTTPGAWSVKNKSENCNLAAFKIELNKIKAIAKSNDTIVCLGSSVNFTNSSLYSDSYSWDFGDNTTSTETSPNHVYTNPGTYSVKIIASDSKKCVLSDTALLNITVKSTNTLKNIPTIYSCQDTNITLAMDNINLATYKWKSNQNTPFQETTNKLTIKITPPTNIYGEMNDGCSTTNYVFNFEKLPNDIYFDKDTSICLNHSINLQIQNISSISWKNHKEWENLNSISLTLDSSSYISFTAKNNNGCVVTDSIYIKVLKPNNRLVTFSDSTICLGDSIKIDTKYLNNFVWSNMNFITQKGSVFYVKPLNNSFYTINYEDPCSAKTENFNLNVHKPVMPVSNDTTICIGDSIIIGAKDMIKYEWQNYDYANLQPLTNQLKVSPPENTIYKITGTDEFKCKIAKEILVQTYHKNPISVSILQDADWENPAIFRLIGNKINSYKWSPSINLDCDTCSIVKASITQNSIYKVITKDINLCIDSAFVTLDFVDNLYVPNAFYPDSKNGNAIFKAVGVNILNYEMNIFNRWGELIITLKDLENGWDGTYKGYKCENDVYVWKVNYTSMRGGRKELHGHVALIR